MAKSEILLLSDGSQPFRTIGWVLEYKDLLMAARKFTISGGEKLNHLMAAESRPPCLCFYFLFSAGKILLLPVFIPAFSS